MKKNFKKIFILFLSVIACFLTVASVNAETVLGSFKATHYNATPPISFPGEYNVIKTTGGKYLFCVHYILYAPNKNINYTKSYMVTDNGMNYILNKAYSTKNDNEHFIYKSALWIYMIDKGIMPGNINVLKTFKSQLEKNNTDMAKQIKNLIAEAKKAGANDTSAPTISVNTGSNSFSLDSTGNYYVSNAVTVNSSTGSYTVTLTSAPEGSSVVKNGNTFTVKVPANKVTSLKSTVSFKVSNTKDTYTSYVYKPNNSSYQPLAATYKDTKTASATGILNLNRTVSVPFLKVDAATGSAISGAELKLTNSKGETIKTWTSTTKAVYVSGLTEGTYTLTETKAPEGYKAIETSVKFSINSEGKLLDASGKGIVQIVISNEKKTGGVSISKQDITNKEELPGATLVVKDSTGKEIDKWVSTNEPHYIEKLNPGKYTLTETIAPEGYLLSTETIEFEVKDDGSITKVVMYNTPKGGAVISKQDFTNKEELPGATLVVKDSEGNIIDEWVSTDKPHYIEKLNPGKYTLTETIAPEGYVLSTETIEFEVKADGTTTKVVMYNKPVIPEIPVESTASFKTMTSTIIGTLIIIAGSYMIFKNSKKKEIM